MARALIFDLGGQRLALPEGGRREVLVRGPVVPLPHGAPLLLGLTALHGQAVPLLDLAALLGCPPPTGHLTLLADLGGELLAWPVEEVGGLTELPALLPGHAPFGEPGLPGEPRPVNPAALVQRVRAALQPGTARPDAAVPSPTPSAPPLPLPGSTPVPI